jgi:uncharacterized protein YggE
MNAYKEAIMKNKMVLILTGLLMVVVLSACQAAAVPSPQPFQRYLMGNGQGQVRLTPDLASISIGVHSQGPNVGAALNENNAKAQAVSQALQAAGVEPKDIQTSAFSITPSQQPGPNGEMTGEVIYMVDNTVNVTVRDLTKIGQLLDTVVQAGANSIYNIQFDVSNKEEALAQARKLAIENAKKQAAAIAEEAGVTLGEITSVSVSSNPVPMPMFDGKGGMSASNVPVAAGQMVITIDASVQYELK